MRGEVHHAPAHAVPFGERVGSLDEGGGTGPEAEEERPGLDPAGRAPPHRVEHRGVLAEGLLGRLLHAARPGGEVPGPPAEDRPHADRLDRVRDRAHVEERACLAERRRARPDHLDAGEEG